MRRTLAAPDEQEATGGFRIAALCHIQPAATQLTAVTRIGATDWQSHGPTFTAASNAPAIDPGRATFWVATGAQSFYDVHRYARDFIVQPIDVAVMFSAVELINHLRPSMRTLVGRFRASAGLNVTEAADLLGVSRRTIYGWSERDAISPENESRLSAAVEALMPLTQRWTPIRVRRWLERGDPSPKTLLKQGAYSDVRRAAKQATETGGIPLLTASQVGQEVEGDEPIQPLGAADRQAYLVALTEVRPAQATAPWIPPEITYSDPELEE
jgi:DNA-binding XRE family transcriptional regulator